MFGFTATGTLVNLTNRCRLLLRMAVGNGFWPENTVMLSSCLSFFSSRKQFWMSPLSLDSDDISVMLYVSDLMCCKDVISYRSVRHGNVFFSTWDNWYWFHLALCHLPCRIIISNNNDIMIRQFIRRRNMWRPWSHYKGAMHPVAGSRDVCTTAPDGRWPLDQAHGLQPLARL